MTNRVSFHTWFDRVCSVHGNSIKLISVVGRSTGRAAVGLFSCSSCSNRWESIIHNVWKGTGCAKCSGKYVWTIDERLEQMKSLNNCVFVRWLNGYSNQLSKAIVKCSQCGREWSVSVNNLLNSKSSCPHCAIYGYNPAKHGTLYALRSECGTMVKIGISNNYEQRHVNLKRSTPFKWNCVTLIHGDGALIADLEKMFHQMTEQAVFTDTFDGYTEWRVWKPEIGEWLAHWRDMLH